MRYLYSVLFYLLTPVLLARVWWRGRHNKDYQSRWKERFAHIKGVRTPCLWVHAVSLGESIAATPLIQSLAKTFPDTTIIVTTNTATGAAHLKKIENEQIKQLYIPYDLPSVIKRFLKKCQPTLCIIMETELWPNLLHYTHKANIPIVLANARLSARSFKRYEKIKGFCQSMLNNLSLIAAQSEADGQRFCQLGIDHKRVVNAGNIKFDQHINEKTISAGKQLKTHFNHRPTFIAASTHAGEEEIILSAFQQIKKVMPDTLLILVPRHPERFQSVANVCKNNQVKYRSKNELPDDQTDIYLGDTVGELTTLYAASDVAFVGGSLTPVGGHNLLEPALLKLPILSGPHLHNFAVIKNLLVGAVALSIVGDANTLAEQVIHYLGNASLRSQDGNRAYQAVINNQGALKRHVNLIKNYVK